MVTLQGYALYAQCHKTPITILNWPNSLSTIRYGGKVSDTSCVKRP